MRPTAKSSKRTVYYNDRDMYLFIDGVRINSANGEHHRNLTESNFASIPNRDRFVEHLLMMASAMLVDYHYHRRLEDVYDWNACTYRPEIVDESPKESKAILLEVYECCRIILKKVFQDDWMSRTGYISLVIFLMRDICVSLKDFNVYLNLSEELKNMVPYP